MLLCKSIIIVYVLYICEIQPWWVQTNLSYLSIREQSTFVFDTDPRYEFSIYTRYQ